MARVPITPKVLKWAVDESGYTYEEIAAQIKVELNDLTSWMRGEGQPHWGSVTKLAQLLKRPPATFLLPEPPAADAHPIQFRHPLGEADRLLNPPERIHWREARRLQKGVSWLLRELEGPKVTLPKFAVTGEPDRAASRMRELLGVSVETQLDEWKNESQAQHGWRAALERAGIFVLLLPMGAKSARGFSSNDQRAPFLAVNTSWRPSARIFTMIHELGHLVSGTDSACIDVGYRHASNYDPVERWCERFAASFLLPWDAVRAFMESQFGWTEGTKVTDLSIPKRIASKFKVSLKAAVLRLVSLSIASWDLFRVIPATADEKTGGGGGEGRTRAVRRRDEYGTAVARVFLSSLKKDIVTRGDVLGYLNIGDNDLNELDEIVSVA